jgi:hypothetical protein
MVIADNRTVGPTLHVHLHGTVKSSLDLNSTPYLSSIAYIYSLYPASITNLIKPQAYNARNCILVLLLQIICLLAPYEISL